MLCNDKYCVVAPCDRRNGRTQHENLAKYAGWKTDNCYAGSIKRDGTIGYNSRSVNKRNYGSKRLRGKNKRRLDRNLRSGNYSYSPS